MTENRLRDKIAVMQVENWSYYRGSGLPAGGILPRRRICISPNDRGFMFADGVYEVVRSYRGKLFLWDRHLQRLRRSLLEVRIDFDGLDALLPLATELLERNELLTSDAAVYLQITRGSCPRKHCFPESGTIPTIYIETNELASLVQEALHGVSVITVPDIRWDRCDIKSIALLPNVLAHQRAKEQGAFEAIFVRDGTMTEGTHTNFFAVKNGVVTTHPAGNRILGGITRDVVLELCRKQGLPVLEKTIRFSELDFRPDEIFIAGTTVEILPVVKIDGIMVAEGKPGPVTRQLQDTFREYVSSVCSPC